MQVPDEVMDLMEDPFVIAGAANADLSTKEILKRYQDRMGQRPPVEVNEVHNRWDNSSRPPPTRIDTDPAAYKEARSVRPVQDPPMPSYGNNNPNQGTPPQQMWQGPGDAGHSRTSPYKHEPYNHSDPQLEHSDGSQRRQWRNSGWGGQSSGVGVGGNS